MTSLCENEFFGLGPERLEKLRAVLPLARKLSFDSFVVNISELHVCIKVDQVESFDFLLTDNVEFELEWFFRPSYRVKQSVGSAFTTLLLALLQDYCCNSAAKVDTLYFGTCRFLDVPPILNLFKETIKTLEIYEWSGFYMAMIESSSSSCNHYSGQVLLTEILTRLTCLQIGAFNSRNSTRRRSVHSLMELAATISTGNLEKLVFVGGDYVGPAIAPLLRANATQLQVLEIHHHTFNDDIIGAISDLEHLAEIVLVDVNMRSPMAVYRAILKNNNNTNSLRKLYQRSVSSTVGHPSYMDNNDEEELGQLLSSAPSLVQVSFISQVLHRSGELLNDGSFLNELLLSSPTLEHAEVVPCAFNAEVVGLALQRGLLSCLKGGSLHRNLSLEDMEHICAGLDASTIKDFSLSMGGQLTREQACRIGECLMHQSTLQDLELSSDVIALDVCQPLADGIARNGSLRRFNFMCKNGNNNEDSLFMIPFSRALNSNKTLRSITVGTSNKLDAFGQVCLAMNQLGRKYFLDPSFRFDLWPWILSNIIEDAHDVFYHVVKSSPTIVKRDI